MSNHVQFNDVSLTIKGDSILKNIDLNLEDSKIYGLLGRNGAGKTSLLSLLAAFRPVTSGQIELNEETIFENPNAMQQICFSYDKDYSDETEKVESLLKDLPFFRPNFDYDYAMELVNRFNLPLKKPLQKLSTGMQSAFNVTVGLASRCPITIFDESYLGMDAPTRDLFYREILNEQTEHPRIFILSTHLVSEMDHLFDEVVMIQNGEMLLADDYESLMSRAVQITGATDEVDDLTANDQVLNEEKLGRTKSALILTEQAESLGQKAREIGLETQQPALQDLFIHLTKEVDSHANNR
ncbi:ATP-binding cassette domain-containing protein [Alkalibacillus salilacus]|uniref:ABC-2 type transport system ATP-binding protein n=1 Tax=Alkalibacillus salilacus TaxID=284582 RepID=A0ABT9VHP4_9BACI|nr:ABC transporter ATP-binding protein [Alkalibacillus salilacus]MDQ0160473.1 ABC-2 type transport system ATP-binding protein [Alkalibacillus salilacus]